MVRFLNLLQFLTRLTVKKDLEMVDDMGRTLVFFPLVGAVVGFLMFAISVVLCSLLGDRFYLLVSLIVVMFEAMITGGLHIDGFGDTFDGIFSYRPKDKILEIMKDPTMGTNGVLAIIFLVVTKIICIYLLLENGLGIFIFQVPIMARFAPVILSYKTVSARKNGMGELFIGKAKISDVLLAFSYMMFILLVSTNYFLGWKKMIIIFAVVAVVLGIVEWFKRAVYKKIGGLTGDILGCGVELSELLFLIISLVLLVKFA